MITLDKPTASEIKALAKKRKIPPIEARALALGAWRKEQLKHLRQYLRKEPQPRTRWELQEVIMLLVTILETK